MVLRLRTVAIAVLVATALAVSALLVSAPVSAQDSSVSIVDFAFSDAIITIEVGSTVTWSNDGATTHTVTGDGAEFDSGDIAPGDSYSVTFDTPGTYGYHCGIHPEMTGTIIVVDSTGDGGATDDTAELPQTGSGISDSGRETNFFLVMMAFAAFAGASLFRRTTRR